MNGDSYWSQSFIWGWGGTLFTVNDQGKITNIGVNSPESVNGWTYLHDKVLGTVAPATWDFKTSYDNMNAGFKAGTTMCIMQGPWQVADILKGAAFTDPTNLVIAPIPTGVNGKTGSPVGGHNWVVSVDVGKNADKAAAVASFLTFMTAARAAGDPGQEPGPAPDQHRRLRRPGRGERPAHQPVERRPGRRDEPRRRARCVRHLRLVHEELPEHDHRRSDAEGRARRDCQHVADDRVQEPDGAVEFRLG